MRFKALVVSALVCLVAWSTPDLASAASVLIIYDTTGDGTPGMQAALAAAGHTVTLSSVPEQSYTGTNPAPTNFDVVIHLNGVSSAYLADMPASGQAALVSYVQNGGGFIHFEWNAYEIQSGRMQGMTDLTLLQRTNGFTDTATVTTVASQAGHPVMAGVPSSWTAAMAGNIGLARTYTSYPSTVLATEGTNDAVVVREYQAGRIVGFHHAGNYQHTSWAMLQNANVQQMYLNAVSWVAGTSVNGPPTANAGGPYSGNQGTAIGLDGSGSTDPQSNIVSYEWDCTNNGSYDHVSTSATGSACTYGNVGSYTLGLRVTDSGGLTDTATASVTVTNTAPTAAGSNYSVNQGIALGLDGSASFDPDGVLVLYEWDCTNNGSYDASSSSPTGSTCTYPSVGVYTLGLRVTDDDAATDTETFSVTVTNTAPTAAAGGSYTGNQGSSVALDGSGSTDPDGSVTLFEWDCTDDGIYDTSSSSSTGSTCTYPAVGNYQLRLRVRDNDGATDTDTASVSVTNTAPTADAGGPYTVNQGVALSMDGSGSSDPDGSIVQYGWDCTNNGIINVTSGSATAATCTYAGVGTFTIALTVTDNNGATNTATTTVTVTNTLPTADAGGPYTAGVPNVPLPLDGSGSFDPDGNIVSWQWDCTNDGSFDSTGQVGSCTYVIGGGFNLRLRVTDDDGGTDEQITTVGVATKTVLFVSDSATDTNIAAAVQADGHTVVTATDQYVAATNETTALTYNLAAFDAVVWSATGATGFGDANDGAATLVNLTSYVTGGGSLLVTGYDSVASPVDTPLATLLGGSGITDQTFGNGMSPVTTTANSLNTGVVDIRGIAPSGGPSDMDSFTTVASDTIAVARFSNNNNIGWSLRSLGAGEIAYISNGQLGPSSADQSWTNTTAGSPGAYNAAVRNFVANSSGRKYRICRIEMAYPSPTLTRPRSLKLPRPLMPITSPAMLNNGPPELPGLMELSTWMQLP